jgi:sugar/nucleoside kinase (ribokinase family)
LAWEAGVVGTVCLDDVTTPLGHRAGQLGGSAVYFSLAASRVTTVHLCGVVGRDAESLVRGTLSGADVGLEGLEVVDGPSRRWRAVHDFERWVTASESSDEGASDLWSRRLSRGAIAAEVLFVGSMDPLQQREALAQGDWRLIGADSMIEHIEARQAAVREVAEASHVLFLNRAELSALTGRAEDDWAAAATGLLGRGRLRAVVVKAGPLGAACVSAAGIVHREAHPVEPVVDPTGAGDSVAGGFLGACAAARRDDDAFFPMALDAGLRCAADAIADFGTAALRAGSAGRR